VQEHFPVLPLKIIGRFGPADGVRILRQAARARDAAFSGAVAPFLIMDLDLASAGCVSAQDHARGRFPANASIKSLGPFQISFAFS